MIQANTTVSIVCPKCKKNNVFEPDFNEFNYRVVERDPEDPYAPITILWEGQCKYCHNFIYDVRL